MFKITVLTQVRYFGPNFHDTTPIAAILELIKTGFNSLQIIVSQGSQDSDVCKAKIGPQVNPSTYIRQSDPAAVF